MYITQYNFNNNKVDNNNGVEEWPSDQQYVTVED